MLLALVGKSVFRVLEQNEQTTLICFDEGSTLKITRTDDLSDPKEVLVIEKPGYFYNTYHPGHAGIVISADVVISANENAAVRVGQFSPSTPNAGFQYLRYKP